MRKFISVFALICGLFMMARPAAAVTIDIDLTTQSMHVTTNAGENFTWPVSTARAGYATPHGYYTPYSLQVMHYSHKYHMSPMPHSIFFHGGYAIHGTYSVAELGRPASHGCIRLSPANATKLFGIVKQEGARISISGTPPRSATFARAGSHKRVHVAARHHHRHAGHALAYAPSHRAPSLHQWMKQPGSAY
jgi:hypothetical protein